jgi:hypothetical protein
MQQLRQWRGKNDEDPSHGTQTDDDRAAGYLASQSNAILSAMSHDDDDDDSPDEMARAEIDDHRNQRNLMAERNAKIMERNWRRRVYLSAEEEDDDESVIQSQAKNNPYRRLVMQEQFTPPRKRSKTSQEIEEHAYIYGSEDKRRKWRRWIDTLADIEGPQRTPPVVPSMMLLRALDIGGQHRTAELFSDKVDHMRGLYYDLVVDPWHSCRQAYWNYSHQYGGSFGIVSSAPAGTW